MPLVEDAHADLLRDAFAAEARAAGAAGGRATRWRPAAERGLECGPASPLLPAS